MVLETALLGIACLMTNASPEEKAHLSQGLTFNERLAVANMKPLCTPERLTEILNAGREAVSRGEANDARAEANPTLRC